MSKVYADKVRETACGIRRETGGSRDPPPLPPAERPASRTSLPFDLGCRRREFRPRGGGRFTSRAAQAGAFKERGISSALMGYQLSCEGTCTERVTLQRRVGGIPRTDQRSHPVSSASAESLPASGGRKRERAFFFSPRHFQMIYSHCLGEQKHVILERSQQLLKNQVDRQNVGPPELLRTGTQHKSSALKVIFRLSNELKDGFWVVGCFGFFFFLSVTF